MGWQDILGLIAIVVAVGSASAIGLMRDRLRVLADLKDDLESRIDFLEKKDTRNEAEKVEMRSEIARLQDHEEYLTSLVRDRANYTTISVQLEGVASDVVAIKRKVGA